MFIKKTEIAKTGLDKAIDDALSEMSGVNCDSEEYATMLKNLERLYALREKDLKTRVSPETIALIAANLAGIAMILTHERAHVVTSKALSFVMKLR